MTEQQALEWIHNTEKFGSVLGLDTIRELMRRLGDPQKKLRFIHTAGTNGKGSVCTILARILQCQGYRTGLYTSPFVERFGERICVDSVQISGTDLARCTERVKEVCDRMKEEGLAHPTEFELVTAVGMLYFAQRKCDFVVLEVGMGGRLDATNVIDPPLAAVITTIDYDHVDRLGNTLSKIAFEKCGIIKPGSAVVSAPFQHPEVSETIRRRAAEEGDALFVTPDPVLLRADWSETSFCWNDRSYTTSLLGGYQMKNAATVLQTAEVLRERGVTISDEAIRDGLLSVRHIARMEKIRPDLLLDGGHNLSGISELCQFLRQNRPENGRLIIVAGMLADKDHTACAKLLRETADLLIATQTDSARRYSAAEFAHEMRSDLQIDDPVSAVRQALDLAEEHDLVVVCGSFTLVGPIRAKFRENQ